MKSEKKILIDEPGASLEALYDGERFLLVDREDKSQWSNAHVRIIPLTPAQAVKLAQWILSVSPANCGKG